MSSTMILLFFRCECDNLPDGGSSILIGLKVVYPKSCGNFAVCKEKNYGKVRTALASYTNTFSMALILADGQSIRVDLRLCKSIVDVNLTCFSTLTISTTTTTTIQGTVR